MNNHISNMQPTVEELLEEVKDLTIALTGLTCGGSEFFNRKSDRYVADIDACVDYVRKIRMDQHETILKAYGRIRELEGKK